MDNVSFDQISMLNDLIGDKVKLLKENVEVTINENIYNFNKYDVKQLTSSSCNLKNVSSNTARMIMVYK